MQSAKQGSYRYHFFKVFWYDLTRGINPRSTDCEADALITTPLRRFLKNLLSFKGPLDATWVLENVKRCNSMHTVRFVAAKKVQ